MITVTTPQPVNYPPLAPAAAAGSPNSGNTTPAVAPSAAAVPPVPDGRINTYA